MGDGKVLVTGANGFIGAALVRYLNATGRASRAAVRRQALAGSTLPADQEIVAVGDLGPDTDWRAALAGVTTVVHTAARAHVLQENATNPLALFRVVNVAATLRLARQAAAVGVQRLVFLSSIGVLGVTSGSRPFTATTPPAPYTPYALSKWEAEDGLRTLASETGMEVVILRPPLVYGPGARGNFARLVMALRRGLPLPLAGIDNRRSLLALDNLIDLVACCMDHPTAAGQTFLAADGEDLSTTEMVVRLGRAMGRRPRLFMLPEGLMRSFARMAGQPGLAHALLDSLQIDIASTRKALHWRPVIDVDSGLQRALEPPSC